MGYPNSTNHMVDTGELGINNGALSYSAYIADVHDSNLSNADGTGVCLQKSDVCYTILS